jgi:probable addiction module antidote protein
MPRKTSSYNSWRLEKLSDPGRAARYLTAALGDSTEAFLHACKNVLQAHQVSAVAKKAGVTRETLYRSFSATGNPTLETLESVLRAVDLKISGVEPRTKASPVILSSESVKAKSVRRPRRHRGSRGRFLRQLCLPFGESAPEAMPNEIGTHTNAAQQQPQAVEAPALRIGFISDAGSSSLPGFLAYLQNQSATSLVCHEGNL